MRRRWIPHILLICGLIFLITPSSAYVQWKFDGKGRILSRSGVININLAGFGFAEGYTNRGIPEWDVFITLGFPVQLLCVVLAARIAIREIRSQSRISTGCPTCGYDLRATPDRCPECGECPPVRGYKGIHNPSANMNSSVPASSVSKPTSTK